MKDEKRKPNVRLSKALNAGTDNRFVARLTVQMFDLLECSSLEDEKREKIQGALLGLMQLFLKEETWIEEFSKKETAFFQKIPSPQTGTYILSPDLQVLLGELDQLARAFFLNLNLSIIQGGSQLASILSDNDIKGLDSLLEFVEALAQQKRLRFIKSAKAIREAVEVWNQFIFKFNLESQNLHHDALTGKDYIAVSPSGQPLSFVMKSELDRCFQQLEELIVDLIATKCPDNLAIHIDETGSIKNKKYVVPGLRNEFWLPYFGYYWWQSISEENEIKKSESNKSERDFVVNFFLERTDSKEINDSAVILLEEKVMHIETPSEEVYIKLYKNDQNRLRMIACRIRSSDRNEALRKTYSLVTKLLSYQTFMYALSSKMFAMTIADTLNQAKWECKPQFGAPVPLYFPSAVNVTKELDILLSIYREAKDSVSPFYRFLCYYKLLEAFYEHRYVFSAADQIIKENKLQLSRPKRSISKSMVVKSMLYHRMDEFVGKSYGKYFEYLRSNERIMVAHVFPSDKNKEMADLNDYDLYSEFVSLGNLTDLVARDILFDELTLWQHIDELVPMSPPEGSSHGKI